jgi:DNA-binding response OmpR family regulator
MNASSAPAAPAPLGDISIDVDGWVVSSKGNLDLTDYEQKILAKLLETSPFLASKQQIQGVLYPEGAGERTTNVLEVMISRIRKKLRAVESSTCINTVRGRGYVLALRQAESQG